MDDRSADRTDSPAAPTPVPTTSSGPTLDATLELAGRWNQVQTWLTTENRLRPQHRPLLNDIRLMAVVEDTALLSAPSEFAKNELELRMRPDLLDALQAAFGRELNIAVSVSNDPPPAAPGTGASVAGPADLASDASPAQLTAIDGDRTSESFAGPDADFDPDADLGWNDDSGIGRHRMGAAPATFPRSVQALTDRASGLNPKYTFESFVIGAGNRFTHAAAVAVAEAPARAYNPLFVYGDSGLGKTHLLHAIGNYAGRLHPGLRTRYVSSEEFTNDFINSVRDDKMQAFQDRYRSVDVLLIDDIQFLERAERTQEEFFHTFNTLHNNNKQIVISSDKPPRDMRTLEERLRTRFEWGLISDVQAPDLETRIAILRKKAQAEGMNLPPEVLEFIASRIQTNVRELEGALIRVTAFANLHRRDVDMNLTEGVLRDLVGDSDANEITAADIMAVTAEYFSVSVADLTGSSRSRLLANARQMAMYLCRELTELSLPKIGAEFGGRDHTTVMHADRKIRTQMKEKMAIYNQIAELTSRIRARARA